MGAPGRAGSAGVLEAQHVHDGLEAAVQQHRGQVLPLAVHLHALAALLAGVDGAQVARLAAQDVLQVLAG